MRLVTSDVLVLDFCDLRLSLDLVEDPVVFDEDEGLPASDGECLVPQPANTIKPKQMTPKT